MNPYDNPKVDTAINALLGMRELRDTERLSDLLKVTQLIEGSHVNIHRMIPALIVKALGSAFYFLDLQRPHS